MKRYLLFAGDHYYPLGADGDIIGDYDDLSEATREGSNYDWARILDMDTRTWISVK